MSFLDKMTALLPVGKKEETLEYFFALNIALENLTCALWTIEKKTLKILDTATEQYSSLEDLPNVTDKLLDKVLGVRQIDPQKILFGVPSSWLSDENLKEEKLKVLRSLVKEMELAPMAYVESSHALIHFLEKTEGVPPTTILVGFEKHHLTVTVVRAGKLDGVKTVVRGENSGTDIEKALLTFAEVETLPSKILLYGEDASELKNQLLSHPWMSKLSFLHFPKIETMAQAIEIKSVCFAGASEIEPAVSYLEKAVMLTKASSDSDVKKLEKEEDLVKVPEAEDKDLGFMVGDVSAQKAEEELGEEEDLEETAPLPEQMDEDLGYEDERLPAKEDANLVEVDDFEQELPPSLVGNEKGSKKLALPAFGFVKNFPLKRFIPRRFRNIAMLVTLVGIIGILLGAVLILPKAEIKIFVEPKILEKDTTVIADPNQKTVNEEGKIIPGQIVETEISGSGKDTATGQKEIGNPAKGTVKIINNSTSSQSLAAGTTFSANGIKFTLDSTVKIASTSATATSKSTVTAQATAASVGAEGNVPSETEFSSPNAQVAILAEGNFSGGTSKKVTVVSSDDQSKLLAKIASDLRQQAQQKLQEKLPEKKILEEALSEEVVKKSFNKNVGDQTNEFSLNLTNRYKGTAFEDKDLKSIVSKLVVTQVPEGFTLNLEDTETQADVSKAEKGGKLIFLARFKAKLMPKIDTEKVKSEIKGKDINEAATIIKGMENVLGSEITISPSFPILQRLPLLTKNIKIEVGLK